MHGGCSDEAWCGAGSCGSKVFEVLLEALASNTHLGLRALFLLLSPSILDT